MSTGTFTNHPRLKKALPPLVKQQRALAAKIAVDPQDVKDEKACRADIDVLLVAAGLQSGDLVTCDGYDVTHTERAGQSRIDPTLLTAHLIAAGIDAPTIDALIAASTDTSPPACFATVKASKGAAVSR